MKSQQIRLLLIVALVTLCLAPASSQAITPYTQDFEGLVQSDPLALELDGWKVYGNVFDALGAYLYGYGAFVAPNNGSAFCQIDMNQGGIEQGFQQLSVFSDYENADHANGNIIEANVFQEMPITANDVGKTWKFSFDAKRGNIAGASEAFAYIKTIDPNNGFATTNYIFVDLTATPIEWAGYSLSLAIDVGLIEGAQPQFFQIGFSNTATLYEASANFYDNVVLEIDTVSDVPNTLLSGSALGQNYPNPFNPSTRIDFSLEKAGSVELSVYDVAGRKVASLEQGNLDAGNHHVVWNGKTDAGDPAPTGRYNYVLRTAAGQTARSMILLK